MQLPLQCRLKALAWLTPFLFAVQFFLSNESPLHTIDQHIDSAIFFSSGKAWAHGLIPYVDFADSKGPLLWLLNMAGYWLTPTSYLGLGIVSTVWLIFAFYFCWRTAMLVLGDFRRSMCAAASMVFIYLMAFNHLETRAETFCQLPISYAVYALVLTIRSRGEEFRFMTGFWLGAAVMAVILIKWSVAIMMLSVCAAILACLWGRWRDVGRLFASFFAGAAACFAPFLIYLLITGSLGAFIGELFFVTASTVEMAPSQIASFYLNQARHIYNTPWLNELIPILLATVGSWLCCRRWGWRGWLPPVCAAIFLGLSTYHNYWYYYPQVCGSFALLGIIWITGSVCRRPCILSPWMTATYMCAIIGISAWYTFTYSPSLRSNPVSADIIRADSIVSSQPHARLLCYRAMDHGLGAGGESYPATKYWTFQTGPTEGMKIDQDNAVILRKADFIHAVDTAYHGFITANGYTLVFRGTKFDGTPILLYHKNR